MSVPTRLVVAAVLAIAVPLAASQAPVRLTLATQAPSNSTWHKALGELGATWAKVTSGRVTLQLFPDARLGDEQTVVKKLTGNIQVQAALLTAGGLANIADAFNVFGMPFFIENDAEQQAVQKKLEPRLQEILEAKGVHLIAWGTGGWVELFSKQPIRTLAELKASKLYTGDDRLLQWYTTNGFNAVLLPLAEITTQLKLPSGNINAAPNTPYLAMMTQIFTPAPYMLDLHIAPLVGALIVSTKAWNSISADDRAKLTEAARAMEAKIRSEIPALDATSLAEMTKKGLQVVKLAPPAAAEFRAAATDMVKTMRGKMVPADIFDMALAERDAFRKGKK